MIFRRNYSEGRRWPRQWWNNSVEVFTDSSRLSGIGVNISDGGMCLFAVADLPVGTQIQVQFRHTHTEQPIKCLAIIRHRALYLYGVEFDQESDPKQAVMDARKEA